jgi:serine protease DegS
MKLKPFLIFVAQAVTVGLAAAIVVIFLLPYLPVPGRDAPGLGAVRLGNPDRTGRIEDSSFAPAVASAAPAVVNIFTTRIKHEQTHPLLEDPIFRRFFSDQLQERESAPEVTHLGSGVIVGDSGHVLTNYHVIEGMADIRVMLYNGRTARCALVGVDPETDLAALRLELDDVDGITIADAADLRVGDVVLAIGNPYGWGQTVTMGIVSATGRRQLGLNTFENFIQTDAAINPGNSGGALINVNGELVGINTAIYTRSGGSEGIGFAIPAALALSILDQLVSQGEVRRGWLGISATDVTPALLKELGVPAERPGVLIANVISGSPAERAGLHSGDLITAIDGVPTPSSRSLLDLIAERRPGTAVRLSGWRNDKPLRVVATVGQRPATTP